MSTIQRGLSLIDFEIHVYAKTKFLPFDLWPWTKVKGHFTKRKPIFDFLYVLFTNIVSISHCFWYICENSICDLWPWTKVKFHFTKWKPICDFLYVYNTNVVSISHCFRYICENSICDLWPWTKVKFYFTKWKPIWDFLYVCNTNGVSSSSYLWDIWGKVIFWPFKVIWGQISCMDLHQKLIISSTDHKQPMYKISWKSIHNFLRYLVHKQKNRLTGRQTAVKTYPPWRR